MAIKYVDNFEFPATAGFTGSAGKQPVKGYMRGGVVKAPNNATKGSTHDKLLSQGKKLGFASGGFVKAPNTDPQFVMKTEPMDSMDHGVVPAREGRTAQEIEAGGTKRLKPGFKKGGKVPPFVKGKGIGKGPDKGAKGSGKVPVKKAKGGAVVKKSEGGEFVLPANWSTMTDAQKRTWANQQNERPKSKPKPRDAAAPKSQGPKTIDDVMKESSRAMGVAQKAEGGAVWKDEIHYLRDKKGNITGDDPDRPSYARQHWEEQARKEHESRPKMRGMRSGEYFSTGVMKKPKTVPQDKAQQTAADIVKSAGTRPPLKARGGVVAMKKGGKPTGC